MQALDKKSLLVTYYFKALSKSLFAWASARAVMAVSWEDVLQPLSQTPKATKRQLGGNLCT
jgi:hypothetical protein